MSCLLFLTHNAMLNINYKDTKYIHNTCKSNNFTATVRYKMSPP